MPMDNAMKPLGKILLVICCLVLFYLSVVFIAATAQLAEAADRLYLGLGQPVFFTILGLFFLMVLAPVYLYFMLPRALVPPVSDSGPEHEAYLEALRNRLNKNPRLAGNPIRLNAEIPQAIQALSSVAEEEIKSTAGAVFLSTAIMQNGRLDGLITLVTQSKLVWKIACIYHQRPSPRQMIYLYTNVAAAALIADSIDDIDISEIIAPILSSSVASAMPGASLIVNSITNGAANAFLTLRVGMIAMRYCEATSRPNQSLVRRNGTIGAAALLSGVVRNNSGRLLEGSWRLASKAVTETVGSAAKGVKTAASSVSSHLGTAVESTVKGTWSAAATVADGVSGALDSSMSAAKKGAQKVTKSIAGGTQQIAKKITSK